MRPPVLTILFALCATTLFAQLGSNLYGITGDNPGDASWSSLRTFDPALRQPQLITSNELTARQAAAQPEGSVSSYKKALCSGAAAIALDKGTGRLFYVTMIKGDIRYLDLQAGNQTLPVQAGNLYSHFSLDQRSIPGPAQQGPIVTRLTHGVDQYIYGISNDGYHFFRFAPARPQEVEVLGSLSNHADNGAVSIHTQATSWGGDMVPDQQGNFYVYSAAGHVFYIHTVQRQAQYLGSLSLPQDFVVSGAAALEDGSVLLTSSTGTGAYLVLETPQSLSVRVFKGSFNASDLASTYFAGKQPVSSAATPAAPHMQVYPNPVQGGAIRLHIPGGLEAGTYQCAISDAGGRRASTVTFQAAQGQTQVTLQAGTLAKGIYQLQVHSARLSAPQVLRVWVP